MEPGFARRPKAEADAGTAAPARMEMPIANVRATWHGQPRAAGGAASRAVLSDCVGYLLGEVTVTRAREVDVARL
jgi:hypothetical protein